MAKTIRSISINGEVWDSFTEIFPGKSKSEFIENCMSSHIESMRSDSGRIDLKLLRTEEKKLEEEYLKITARIQNTKRKIETTVRLAEEAETARLEKEKEFIKSQRSCSGCGNVISEPEEVKKFNVNGVPFCKSCFLSGHPKFKEVLKKTKEEGV